MAKPKFDGVVQAVRYDDDGHILWVRAFLRRGPIWSDHVMLERGELIAELKSGRRIVAGERIPFYGSTFETTAPIELIERNSHEVIISGDVQTETDCLEGVPLI
jgi:hypothetical protein